MKVKTIRKHFNSYPPQYAKNPPRIYDVPDRVAKNLISSGHVEAVHVEEDED